LINYSLEPKYQEIFDYLSLKAKEAYKDIDMLSNETLSKNPFSSVFIRQKLENSTPSNVDFWFILKKLLTYYKKSFKGFYYYIVNFFIYLRYAKKFDFKATGEEIIIVDTFFIIDKVLERQDGFSDSYFGLDDTFQRLDKEYVYIPVFYGLFSPAKMREVFSILRKKEYPVVCEYDLLSMLDFVRILCFIIRYPFKVINFTSSLDSRQYNDRLLHFAMLDGLGAVTFHRYSRYLQGKRFARFKKTRIKLISWYENQTIDKNLYRGMRDSDADTYIIGAQLFLFSCIYMSVLVDENEISFKTVPDKVLVNGEYYLPESSIVKFEVGPSLRYKKLFECNIQRSVANEGSILVLLSYFLEDARNVLEMISHLDSKEKIILKAHPATDINLLKDLLKTSYMISSVDIYDLAKEAKLVVASATGAMLELASIGLPIVVVKSKDAFEYNPLTELGDGVLWYAIDSKEELLNTIETISTFNDCGILKKIGNKHKVLFFCEPTEENIKKAFEL